MGTHKTKISLADMEMRRRLESTITELSGVPFSDITSPSKRRDICYARDLYCYFMRKRTSYPLCDIGKILHDRNHNTAMYASGRIKKLSEIYQAVRDDIKTIDQALKNVAV